VPSRPQTNSKLQEWLGKSIEGEKEEGASLSTLDKETAGTISGENRFYLEHRSTFRASSGINFVPEEIQMPAGEKKEVAETPDIRVQDDLHGNMHH
jgi:hypothetical protein